MANPEHLEILKSGVKEWNVWRRKHRDIVPDLTGADLRYANLSRANLSRAGLTGAGLTRAGLRYANLSRAGLTGADLPHADLTGADLAHADLRYANLSRAGLSGADLAHADLTGANLPAAPYVQDLDARILDIIDNGRGVLDMSIWHTCETTHCRAGWAIKLAGAEGTALEEEYGSEVAGALIYHASTSRVPDFYASDEDAMDDMRDKAGA